MNHGWRNGSISKVHQHTNTLTRKQKYRQLRLLSKLVNEATIFTRSTSSRLSTRFDTDDANKEKVAWWKGRIENSSEGDNGQVGYLNVDCCSPLSVESHTYDSFSCAFVVPLSCNHLYPYQSSVFFPYQKYIFDPSCTDEGSILHEWFL